MAGKQTASITLALLLLAAVLPGQERTVRLGGPNDWQQELTLRAGIELEPGFRDYREVRLAGAVHRPDADTDLLLHFDEAHGRDATGRYELAGDVATTTRVARRGTGAAAFRDGADPLRVRPIDDAMFTPGRVWGDFTIEFWLYPTRTAEGETVLLWEGARSRAGTTVVPQGIRATVSDRRLVWRFRNVFLPPDQSELEIALESRTDLVPRTWQHHMLRYDSSSGLLEYLRNGRSEDIAYATSSGTERGAVFFPYIGDASDAVVEIGRSLVGFVDEMRVSQAFREPPELDFYTAGGGTVITRPVDLGSPGARLQRVEARYRAPGTSAVHFYYRSADTRTALAAADPDADWTAVEPGRALPDGVRTRFVQLRAELYPDGERRRSPRLIDIGVVYEPDVPPAPPSRVVAIPGDGEVTLRWQRVPEPDLTGYTVFYGTRSGRYFGTEASIGSSPVAVGEQTEVTIDGLDNGALYYFAVASRDASSTSGESVLSSEVTARPSRLGR